ncbi:LAME_0E04588g1_1 [Lachancea meyersii CBS 8951]|uniref:LAME_0E04588g1_1 n=1 Tax=Lachancea meyersii CBS 8951 TaxID=1266667 RepID=A0A1G4JHB1_9SACH|nr:LAME_0E04588g1_1 [Lachancea meyersii CBS 8951]
MTSSSDHGILWFNKSSVKIGEIERYVITFQLYDDENGLPADLSLNSLWLRIRNIENVTFRAAYLMGPYLLYCDVRTADYHHSQHLFVSADQPKFEPTLQPQQDFYAELSLHNLKKTYVWIVDVASQIIFTNTSQIGFEISIGSSKKSLENAELSSHPLASSSFSKLSVTRLDTLDQWNLNDHISPHANQKEHLVVLTHGLHSNVPADLFYLKEQIEKCQKYYNDEQIVVKGFTGNVCKTERGVKYLGTRLAEYVVQELYNDRVTKISFVGHSLGGLVQAFAVAYIAANYPWFFEKVDPINFITLASPLLGIVTDNPAYINILLSFGIVGKTGQDLGLKEQSEAEKPLLYFLPGEPTKTILKKFKRRTLYANAVNDGIVPLYSASLLFLDYQEVLQQLQESPDFNQKLVTTTPAEFIMKNFISPISKAISLLAPQKFPESGSSGKIPKVSVIESAASILIPPVPEKSYIMDPATRANVIIHDKLYTEADIPARNSQSEKQLLGSDNMLLRTFVANSEKSCQNLEEDIARRWHEGLTWRKVIVCLKPDAHNNIIVRRRFSNAYGWPIVDHLTQNHFNGIDTEPCIPDSEVGAPDSNDLEYDNSWVNFTDKRSLFDVGPTGMISTVTEMLDSLSKNSPMLNRNSSSSRRRGSSFDQDQLFKYELEKKDLTGDPL